MNTPNKKVVVFETAGSDLLVYPRCPECGRFLKKGIVETNWLTDDVRLTGWICKIHGEVKPDYEYGE